MLGHFAKIALTSSVLLTTYVSAALAPGLYTFGSAAFPGFLLSSIPLGGTGPPMLVFNNSPGGPLTSQQITVANGANGQTLQEHFNNNFVGTDQHNPSGGLTGAGIFTAETGDPDVGQWEIVEATASTFFVQLAGTNLVWRIATNAQATQVTLAPLDSSDIKQQWVVTRIG